MTYFGLDLLPIKLNGKVEWRLGEFGGLDTAIEGFALLYHDRRVDLRVKAMLQDKYGPLRFSSGLFFNAIKGLKKTNPDPEEALSYLRKHHLNELLGEFETMKTEHFPFGDEIYLGQSDKVVANMAFYDVNGPSVNPLLAQLIARDKSKQLFMYQEHENTVNNIPGEIYGAIDSNLNVVLGKTGKVIIKDACSSKCKGIEIISEEELIARSKKWTQTADELLCSYYEFGGPKHRIMQPFHDCSIGKEMYASVRSVVCNGKFVDAYSRVSSNPLVGLSNGSDVAILDSKLKEKLGELSEHIVSETLRLVSIMEARYAA
jgi:hypothetical protein